MVMNKKKQVFGTVENVEENTDYVGVKTKTANVTVNNTTKEISVDVDFSGMLGETNDTAYPGHLGAQTRRWLVEDVQNLEAETGRAIAVEQELKQQINNFEGQIATGDSAIAELVADETNRAQQAEAKLQQSILSVDSKVQNQIKDVIESVARVEESIQTEVADLEEQIRNQKEDLTSAIHDSAANNSSNVAELNNRLSDVVKTFNVKLLQETSSREKSDTYLESNIELLRSETTSTSAEFFNEVQRLDGRIDDSVTDLTYDLYEHSVRLQNIIKDTEEKLSNHIDIIEYNHTNDVNDLTAADVDLQSKIQQLRVETIDSDDKLQSIIDEHKDDTAEEFKHVHSDIAKVESSSNIRVEEAEGRLNDRITASVTKLSEVDTALKSDITSINNNIEENYATKTYVHSRLVEFSKLSKQIVDYVDVELNGVVVDGKLEEPVDGVIYLVKDDDATVEDIYKEYVTIDGQLTLIGDTSTDLKGYATEEWVQGQKYLSQKDATSTYAKIDYVDNVTDELEKTIKDAVNNIDLSLYAKKEDLPTNVSELRNDADYATKTYVNTQSDKKANKIHTHKLIEITDYTAPDLTPYAKKTDIPDVSSFIAEIPEEYVTEEELVAKKYYTEQDVNKLLNNIKFIDGGTSSSLNI